MTRFAHTYRQTCRQRVKTNVAEFILNGPSSHAPFYKLEIFIDIILKQYSAPDDVIVVVGDHDLTVTESTQKECEVSRIIVHPQYDSWELK